MGAPIRPFEMVESAVVERVPPREALAKAVARADQELTRGQKV